MNLNKSGIIVFRKGGFGCRKEKWFYGDRELQVVSKYLGLYFSIKLSFNVAVRDLSGKAQNAVMPVLSILYKLDNHSRELVVNLLDSQIQPILLCGAEVWGVYGSQTYIDKVQLYALKMLLGLDQRVPTDMVLGDTGGHPLEISCYIRVFIY